jgi:Na+/H+-translocating membrane pyrophosphatase
MTETPYGPEGPFDAAQADVRARSADLEARARRSAEAYRRWRNRYERLYYLLAVPATLLAAVAGATAFAENASSVVIGVCAVSAAGLTGMQTVVRPDRRAKFNQTQQFVMARLAEDAANLARRSSRILTLEEGEAGLSGLYDRYFDALSRSLD